MLTRANGKLFIEEDGKQVEVGIGELVFEVIDRRRLRPEYLLTFWRAEARYLRRGDSPGKARRKAIKAGDRAVAHFGD